MRLITRDYGSCTHYFSFLDHVGTLKIFLILQVLTVDPQHQSLMVAYSATTPASMEEQSISATRGSYWLAPQPWSASLMDELPCAWSATQPFCERMFVGTIYVDGLACHVLCYSQELDQATRLVPRLLCGLGLGMKLLDWVASFPGSCARPGNEAIRLGSLVPRLLCAAWE